VGGAKFVLLIIAALPNETGLPNEYISYRIVIFRLIYWEFDKSIGAMLRSFLWSALLDRESTLWLYGPIPLPIRLIMSLTNHNFVNLVPK
jgi:hypothetical protein